MSLFQGLWSSRSKIIEEFEALKRDAEENAFAELQSVVRIQRLFRGQKVRAKLSAMKAGEMMIARVFRGHLGRKEARARQHATEVAQEIAIFHYHASIIQRTFRGFYSRRYRHDFSARKKYIADIVGKGETLRARLDEALVEQQMREADEAAQREAAEFQKVTQNLHHLVSTRAQPGVFAPPFDAAPTAYGRTVEAHLAAGVKDLLRTRAQDRARTKRLATNLQGAKLVPLRPPAARLSLQASSRYDLPAEQARMDKKLNRLQWVGGEGRGFAAGQRVREAPYRRGVGEGAPYLDPWKNPYRKRGVPQSGEELAGGPRTSLGRHPEVPFYTRVGGNKSTVHPNDTFETILEAEATGGAAQRHKGRTLRYGVPDTADVRGTSQLYMYPPNPPPGGGGQKGKTVVGGPPGGGSPGGRRRQLAALHSQTH